MILGVPASGKRMKMQGTILKIKLSLKALVINLLLLKEVYNTDACPVSRKTMNIVPNCPTSEEEWKKASERKNCSALAGQCENPDKFVYHCVINPFVNQTLEVCAYGKYIVLGHCAEYSYRGNIIQQNYGTDCAKFTHNPCPSGYHSTEAYKYPGCYELTKTSTTQKPTILTKQTSDTTEGVPTQNVSMVEEPEMEHMEGSNCGDGCIIGVIFAILIVLGVAAAVIVAVRRRHRSKGLYQSVAESMEKNSQNSQPMKEIENSGTETGGKKTHPVEEKEKENSIERILFVPSGKPVESESERKTIMPVEGEENPDISINPENEDDEEEDCQRLMNSLNDCLERITKYRSTQIDTEDDEKLEMTTVEIYKHSPSFSDDSSALIQKYIKDVQISLERYFKRQKKTENVVWSFE